MRDDFRKAENKHADKTTWSNDGQNGYAWGFFTENTSLYVFKGTRSSVVPKEVFGDGEHIGVLGVDRYGFKKWISQFCINEGLSVVNFKELCEAWQHGSVRR